jgi:hypothetical protein
MSDSCEKILAGMRGSRAEFLRNNRAFIDAVEELISGNPKTSEPMLCAALILSTCGIHMFDKWLEHAIAETVWTKRPFTRISEFLTEYQTKVILGDWMQNLGLLQADIQDAIWTVFIGVMKREEMRQKNLLLALACIIFACAKLFDIEKSFAQIIKAADRDERMFLSVPLEAGRTGNVLQWYNEFFLPRMRHQIVECRCGKIPFPSMHTDTVFLTPFVSFSLSPFKNHLTRWQDVKVEQQMEFSPWHQT